MPLQFSFTDEKKAYENAPAGQYIATVIKILDKGTQEVTYKGVSKKVRQLLLSYELHDLDNPDNLTSEGKPFSVSSTVSLMFAPRATLTKIVKAAIGFKKFKEMDETKEEVELKILLLGKSVILNVIHKKSKDGETTYSNIDNTSIAALVGGVKAPETVNDLVFLSLEVDEFDPEILEGLSDKLQEIIKSSPEFIACVSNGPDF